jgi:hypothetical protein
MPITISLGDPRLIEFGGRGTSLDSHPSGLKFYQGEWDRGNLQTVKFEHGIYGFSLENVLSVLGTEDKSNSAEGIYGWNINFGVSRDQADTDEAARDMVMRLLGRLRAAGWRRYIYPSEPRLSGAQAWRYGALPEVFLYPLDSLYMPTLDEWKFILIKSPIWLFVADGVYLKFSVNEMNSGKFPGKSTYLLSMAIESEYAFYGIGYAGGDEEKIAQWKKLVPAEVESDHLKRVQIESALEAQGYVIEKSYQDPPFKSLPVATSR